MSEGFQLKRFFFFFFSGGGGGGEGRWDQNTTNSGPSSARQ